MVYRKRATHTDFLLVAQNAQLTLRVWTTPQSRAFAMGQTLTRLFAAHLLSTLRAHMQTTSTMMQPTVQPTCSRTSIWPGIIQRRYFQVSVKVMRKAFPVLWPQLQPLPFLLVASLIHHGHILSSWWYSVFWQLFFNGCRGAGCFSPTDIFQGSSFLLRLCDQNWPMWSEWTMLKEQLHSISPVRNKIPFYVGMLALQIYSTDR